MSCRWITCPRCGKCSWVQPHSSPFLFIEREYCSFECLFADEADPRSAYVRPSGKHVDDIRSWYIEMETTEGLEVCKSEGIRAFDESSARSRAHTQALRAWWCDEGGPKFQGYVEFTVCIGFPSKNMMREQAETRCGRFRQWWNGNRTHWWAVDET
jgi:hypothetical protein